MKKLKQEDMTREEFINWFEGFTLLTPNDIYDLGQLYDEVTKPQWISVEDEEPPKEKWIITYEPTSPIVVGTDIILPDETADEHHITHWMPLPQAPTVAENATVKEKGGEHDTRGLK